MPDVPNGVADAFARFQKADYAEPNGHESVAAIHKAVAAGKKVLYCPKCRGTGWIWRSVSAYHKELVTERSQTSRYTSQSISVPKWKYEDVEMRLPCDYCGAEWKVEPSGNTSPFRMGRYMSLLNDLGSLEEGGTYKITGTCGSGVNRQIPIVRAALGDVIKAAYFVDPKDKFAPLLRWHVANLLAEAAFDDHWYAGALAVAMVSASERRKAELENPPDEEPRRPVLELDVPRRADRLGAERVLPREPVLDFHPAAPALRAGEQILFVGQIADTASVKGNAILLVRVYGYEQYVVVAVLGGCDAKLRDYRLVAGIVTDTSQVVPCAMAVAVKPLRKPSPNFRASSPPPSVSGTDTNKGDADHLAQQQLKVVRMYIANGMESQAINALRKLVAQYPDTKAAAEARTILTRLEK